MEIELAIPYDVCITLIIVFCVIAYSIIGAIVGGIQYKYFSNNSKDDADFAKFTVFVWPVVLAMALIWWTLCLPARFVFNKFFDNIDNL